jgi:hypothetical protein
MISGGGLFRDKYFLLLRTNQACHKPKIFAELPGLSHNYSKASNQFITVILLNLEMTHLIYQDIFVISN